MNAFTDNDNKEGSNSTVSLISKTGSILSESENKDIQALQPTPRSKDMPPLQSTPEYTKSNLSTTHPQEEPLKADVIFTKGEILEKINKIFLNNAKFYSTENDYFITHQKVIGLLTQAHVIDRDVITRSQVDIALREISKSGTKLNLLDFIQFIIKIVEKIYKEQFENNPKEAVNYFLSAFFNNIEDILDDKASNNYIEKPTVNSCTIKSLESIITSEIPEDAIEILRSLYTPLKNIYELYFTDELSNSDDIEKIEQSSLKALTHFCQDFEVLPFVMNKSNLVTYYNFILKLVSENPDVFDGFLIKNIGKCYKLDMFLAFFYHFSLVVYYKQFQLNFGEDKESDINILLFFLQRLENSKGKELIIKRKGRTNNLNKLTFIPTNQKINKVKATSTDPGIKSTKKGEIKSKELFKTLQSNRKIIKEFNSTSVVSQKKKDFTLSKLLNVSDEVVSMVEEKLEPLAEVYLNYSRIGDKTTFNRMALSSYIKFLKHANIIYSIPDSLRKQYLHLGNEIMKKTFNLSQIKTYNSVERVLVSQSEPTLTDEEKEYKKKISLLVNCHKDSKEEKLSEGDASVIFYTLTGPKNYVQKSPKTLLDQNSGANILIGEIDNSRLFDPINTMRNQQNVPTKMDFFIFIKSFELLASKVYPNDTLNDAFIKFFQEKIVKMLPQERVVHSKELYDAIDRINNDKVKEFLINFAPVIRPHYEIYCDENENMRFCHFFEFYKDYNLFPDLVNLIKLKNIFFILSEANIGAMEGDHENEKHTKSELTLGEKSKPENENNNLHTKSSKSTISQAQKGKNCDYINFSLFLESLGIAAMFFNYCDIVTDMDRMLYLCERLNQSKRGNMMMKMKDSVLNPNVTLTQFFQQMKKEYPKSDIKKIVLVPKYYRKEPKKKYDFNEIYKDNQEIKKNKSTPIKKNLNKSIKEDAKGEDAN